MINIDLSYFNWFLDFITTAPPTEVYIYLFTHGGWLVLFFVVFKSFWPFYHLSRTGVYLSKLPWILLAIDIPKGNEQTPKAVEQIFAHLAGAHKTPDLEEQFLGGFMQPWFSFEIVSIEGYIQFIIRAVKKYRDLVEAAIYAQYPDAEITEIEDYAREFPSYFPNKEYNLFGTEYILTNKEECYPIRTYRDFEHTAAEDIFKDPLAALLESFSRIGKGEFTGVQFLVKPIGAGTREAYKKKGEKLVKKMIGAPIKHKDTIISKVGSLPGQVLDTTVEAVAGYAVGAEKVEKKDEMPSLMLHLPPAFKMNVERVEEKIAKISFLCKIRWIYLAKKENYDRAKTSYSVTGAFKQYNVEDMNGLKPDFARIGTHVHYFMIKTRMDWRRTRLVGAYKARSRWKGAMEYLLNIEELASLWHFPMLTVKTPMVAGTQAKRGQPPATLPVEREGGLLRPVEKKAKGAPPPNLPV